MGIVTDMLMAKDQNPKNRFMIGDNLYEFETMQPEIKEGDIFTTEIKMFVLTADCIDETLKGVKFIEDFGHDMICPYKKAIKLRFIKTIK